MAHSMWCDSYVGKTCSCRVSMGATVSVATTGIASGATFAPVIFDAVTDDQLRAECERRKLEHVDEWQARHDMRRLAEHLGIPDGANESDTAFVRRCVTALTADRDEWKAKYDALVRMDGAEFNAMSASRDEWKRRAEAAEAKISGDAGVTVLTAKAEDGLTTRVTPPSYTSAQLKLNMVAARLRAEREKNEQWGPTDEDRLCDDA